MLGKTASIQIMQSGVCMTRSDEVNVSEARLNFNAKLLIYVTEAVPCGGGSGRAIGFASGLLTE